jgi:hypothetical protein
MRSGTQTLNGAAMQRLFRHRRSHVLLALLLLLLLLAYARESQSQASGGVFEIRAHALDSGGPVSGGSFAVHGVIGQPVAVTSSGGVYSATLGLLRQREPLTDAIFANGFE